MNRDSWGEGEGARDDGVCKIMRDLKFPRRKRVLFRASRATARAGEKSRAETPRGERDTRSLSVPVCHLHDLPALRNARAHTRPAALFIRLAAGEPKIASAYLFIYFFKSIDSPRSGPRTSAPAAPITRPALARGRFQTRVTGGAVPAPESRGGEPEDRGIFWAILFTGEPPLKRRNSIKTASRCALLQPEITGLF